MNQSINYIHIYLYVCLFSNIWLWCFWEPNKNYEHLYTNTESMTGLIACVSLFVFLVQPDEVEINQTLKARIVLLFNFNQAKRSKLNVLLVQRAASTSRLSFISGPSKGPVSLSGKRKLKRSQKWPVLYFLLIESHVKNELPVAEPVDVLQPPVRLCGQILLPHVVPLFLYSLVHHPGHFGSRPGK